MTIYPLQFLTKTQILSKIASKIASKTASVNGPLNSLPSIFVAYNTTQFFGPKRSKVRPFRTRAIMVFIAAMLVVLVKDFWGLYCVTSTSMASMSFQLFHRTRNNFKPPIELKCIRQILLHMLRENYHLLLYMVCHKKEKRIDRC